MKRKRERQINSFAQTSVVLLFIILFVCLLVFALALAKYLPMLFDDVDKVTYPLKYEEEIRSASEEFSVPQEIICSVIYVESSFDCEARSSVGAMGLMQIMPSTFGDIQRALGTSYSDEDLYDPYVNIRAGTYYLSYLYRIFGDWELVHAAYNAGLGKVSEWLSDDRYSSDGKLVNIPFPETESYVEKIETAKEKYTELYFSK